MTDTTAATMRAIQVQRLGGPEVLELTTLPVPEPQAGQVRIKVQAVGLNFADILAVRGEYLTRTRVPMVPGMEFAGIVDKLGEGVTHLQEGQLVAALGGTGAMAEYSVIPAAAVLPIAQNLNAREAAALPVSFYTAYFSLATLGQAKPGEWVVVQAAAGALGTASVQLAKAMGLQVIALASTEEKLEVARSLGADEALLNTRTDLVDAVKSITGGKGANMVLEIVGGRGFQDSLAMLASRGRVLVIGSASREPSQLRPVELMKKNLSVIGVWLMPFLADVEVMSEATAFLTKLISGGRAKPIVGRTFSLEQAGEAFDFVWNRASTGKVVIEP
ncbi:NADPH:quinone oxidoreductase family protein [Deinococcus yavapaiensis]|uniref:NADPH:quinone reductase-like Zn-dependent oxidoreductase n=1 Tax=Deinococcus yavapaiensis KR-236 TaxID=694435 RepID=A0A318S8L2_9DEIO|nr:NADPH:quinone oxidoreductase family protein [Deinococcus yavapaiensis]PYE54186.1 NADPH:quinone reductase-like Zn-dependent oxidoreductase [Deinococcus yavapaiensis KR-236]